MREQRINPLLVGTLSYGLGFGALWLLDAPALVQGLMFCYATNTVLVVLLAQPARSAFTRWWKVSVHTTAAGGPVVPLLAQFGLIAAPLLRICKLSSIRDMVG